MSRRLSGRVGLAVGAGALMLTTACDGAMPGVDPGPDPEPVVEALATALGSGDFNGLTFTDTTPSDVFASYLAVTDGVTGGTAEAPAERDIEPTVAVGDISTEEATDGSETATADLTWTWPLGPVDWTYGATVSLELVEDAWQVVWDEAVIEPSLRGTTELELVQLGAGRGEILGQGGAKIVTDREVVRVGIDRTQVGKARAGASARALAQLAGVEPAGFAQRVTAAGDKAFVEAITLRTEDVPQRLVNQYESIKGARLLGDEIPLAPTRGFAAPILGTVGEVTAEMIEEEPERFSVGDTAGLSGLQQRYDEQLQGTPGLLVEAVASDGRQRELFRFDSGGGQALETTLDVPTQRAAEQVLADVGPESALVALRPSDGHVLAAANGPGNGGINLATFGQYAPGSTFKTVSALALLRSGVGPGDRVQCDARTVVNGKPFTNYSDYPSGGLGSITLRQAVANSCNTAFISARGRLGGTEGRQLADAAGSLGMGIDSDVGYPAYFGQVEPATGETEAAANLIGQGRILASPLTMATVMASVVAGERVTPTLIPAIEVPAVDHTPLKPAEAEQLRTLLRAVVTEGSGRGLADLPGPPALAKTGTAEFDDDGTIRTHAWMIAAQGDLAVAVFVRVGSGGSSTAGPIVEQFLRSVR